MHYRCGIIIALAITGYAITASPQTTIPQQTVSPTAPRLPENVQASPPAPVDAPRSASPSVSSQPTLLTRTRAEQGLRVGGGDLLQVSVFGAPDYNYDVRVADDGYVNLPLIGTVRVAGMTPREVAADLRGQLSQHGYFNNPEVGVLVKEYATQGVSVLGEVQKPGIYPLLGARTLFDLISAAQGTTPTAGDRVSVIHRDRPQQPEIVKLNYDARDSTQSNVPVFPGDTIVVQKAGIMYVVGDVQKPSGIVMVNPNLTVLKAIALAQGTNPNAALDGARLVRKTADGQTEIPLHLKQMLAAKIPDMRVEPEDVIFVPNSMFKTGFKKGLEAAIATVTGVVIYHR
ncbi:MAG: polysaccharide biosynthesis/export family protein [Candidatus Angelobacter sp.]